MSAAAFAATAGVGYLVGSIPVALVVGDRYGIDLRAQGDHNPGYWNARALLGGRRALPVLAGDGAKGMAAALAGAVARSALGGGRGVIYAGVGAAMIGHAWPAFARLRGGRSILVFVGGMAVISPVTFAIGGALCLAVWLGTRSLAFGARAGVFAAPCIQVFFDGWRWSAATFALMSVIGLRFALATRARRPTSGGGRY